MQKKNKKINYESGYIAVEWAIVTFLLIVALFAPVLGGQSVMGLLMDSIRGFYANSSLLYSLP